MAKITINNISINPATQGPALAAADLLAPDASTSNYILIQTKQPLDKAQKAALAAKGVVILEYVPDNTYVCEYRASDLNEIRALPYVAWANVYMQGFKIAPALAAPPGGPRVRSLLEMTARPERVLSTTPKTVEIIFHRNVDPATVRNPIATAARIDPGDLKRARGPLPGMDGRPRPIPCTSSLEGRAWPRCSWPAAPLWSAST